MITNLWRNWFSMQMKIMKYSRRNVHNWKLSERDRMQILIERMLKDLRLIIYLKVQRRGRMDSLQREVRLYYRQVLMISRRSIEKWSLEHWNSREGNSKYAEFNSDIVNFRLLFRLIIHHHYKIFFKNSIIPAYKDHDEVS